MCSVLIVDDDAAVREAMSAWATTLGYDAREAASADDALALMDERVAGVAVCDVGMPGHDGLWLVSRLRASHPDTSVVMATASQDPGVVLTSLREGAVDFLTKPFGYPVFRDALARGAHRYREAVNSRRRLHMLQQEVAEHLARLEACLSVTAVRSDRDLESVLDTVATDDGTAAHARRVAALANNMSLSLGIRPPESTDIQRAALLHDIGRVAMPQTILCKAGRLSDEEIAIVREQPRLVSQILERHEELASAASVVRATFERFDGSGYPYGLRGDEIPRGARIIAVADALDAMTHHRMHRDARPLAEALFEVQRHRGTQFDPAAIDALLAVIHLHWSEVSRREAPERHTPAEAEAVAS